MGFRLFLCVGRGGGPILFEARAEGVSRAREDVGGVVNGGFGLGQGRLHGGETRSCICTGDTHRDRCQNGVLVSRVLKKKKKKQRSSSTPFFVAGVP